ncbi:MAG TPA: hypothetical protein VFK05_08525, partial [Polyangiaceae bacterium]|nr:hypothetical protein [Polyangiaceae bacterium]
MNLDELRASGAHALVAELLERFCHDMLGPLSASDSNLSFLLFSDVSESDRVEAERDAKSGLAIMGAQVKALRVISAALAEPIAPRL